MVDSIVDSLVTLFGTTIPKELTVFVISLMPILELRGGLIAARLLEMNVWSAFFFCFITTFPDEFPSLQGFYDAVMITQKSG